MTQDAVQHDAKVLLLGLPGVGKSTFTAAFWGVVNSSQIPGALRLVAYSGNDSYLNTIYEQWSKGLELARTARNAEGLGILELSDTKKPPRLYGKVIIPDLAGDRFTTQWESRVIAKEHQSHLEDVDSALLFVHPTKIHEGQIHDAEMQALDSMLSKSTDGTSESPVLTVPQKPFTPALVPTQTILTDVLQTTLEIGNSIRKVAVVVSAWDLVKNTNDPSDWLKQKLPLLNQYIYANTNKFQVKIWGISAQGVDLGKTNETEREAILIKALKRIIVTDGKKTDSDITRPLKWLFAEEETDGK